MSAFETLLLVAYAAVGAALGFRLPRAGLYVLAGFVIVTPAILPAFGQRPLATTLAFCALFLLGNAARRPREWLEVLRPRDNLQTAVLVFLVLVAASTGVGVARNHIGMVEAARLGSFPFLADVLLLNPSGIAGSLQAAAIAILGVLLFIVAVPLLQDQRCRRGVLRAACFGLSAAVGFAVLRRWVLDPIFQERTFDISIVGLQGFFADIHSEAAYLVLAVAVSAALTAALLVERRPRQAAAPALFGAAAMMVLFFSNSRSGLVAGVIAVFVAIGPQLLWAREPSIGNKSRVALSVVLALFFIAGGAGGAVAGSGSPAESAAATAFSSSQRAPLPDALELRLALWAKAARLSSQFPLWGSGPGTFREHPLEVPPGTSDFVTRGMQTENAHNYFLQFGAEFGIPALGALLALLLTVLLQSVGGLRAPGKPRRRALLLGLVASQLGFLALSLVAHPFLLAEMQAAFWLAAAYATALAVGSKTPDMAG